MSNIKYDLDIAKTVFKENNCKLLEKTYVNFETKMSYQCSCGNISKISLYNFKK